MGKRRPTARSASSSRRSRSPISMVSEAARDASPRPNNHPDRNLRPCKIMDPISVESQSPTIFLATSRQGAQRSTAGFGRQIVGPKVEEADRNSKSRIPGNQTKKLRRFSACKTKRLAELSRRGQRHAKSSSLQFQERGFSPRQFPMRARAQDSAAQSCLGNEQQAALQKLQEIERSRGSEPGPIVMAVRAPRS